MTKKELFKLSELKDKTPVHALVSKTDLVVVKYGEAISVLYGRCHHRGALLGDGYIDGDNLICGVHGWDYRYDTGISEYNNDEKLHKFEAIISEGNVYVNLDEILQFEKENPPPFNRDEYLGAYADTHPEDTEPYTGYIKSLSKNGLKKVGHHGETVSMGVDRNLLPKWEHIQYLPAQLYRKPLLDDADVNTHTIIGPKAKKPLRLKMPVFVSDMSFGALSKEAKIALSKGAELAGTGICSGEGGMLPDEQANNSRYFYELASAGFGFKWELLTKVQAFHFKAGQGAKSGVGGHLPGNKVTKDIAEVRGINEGESAISPATFRELKSVEDFKEFAEKVRSKTGGIPIGFKLAAGHIEKDMQFALDVGLMLGADAIAVANSAIQAIGCLGMRACATDFCPVGIATQKESLRSRLIIDASAKQLHNFFHASNELLKVISRSCGYDDITKFNAEDLITIDRDMHHLTGINYAGV